MGEHTRESGVTLVELMVSMFVFLLIAGGFLGLYTALVRSSVVAKRQASGLTLATNQMEYLKSLPYDDLAVSGGSIIASNYIPASVTKKVNNFDYIVKTSVGYIDDAFDGCTNYPSQALKQKFCRGYSSNTTNTVDTNPADYKIANVTVVDKSGTRLATIDSQFAARVAETASTTGALFITVVDSAGTPISGANVNVTNTTVSPAVNANDSTDVNGIAVFYGLPVDTGTDYVLTASKTGYSTLNTIAASGSLQPTYPNLTILSQQSSSQTLALRRMAAPSLLVQTTDLSGNAIPNVQVYTKGGYKRYTSASDTSYYYDSQANVSDATGLVGISNLVPGPYYFCGDNGATQCRVGGTTYYLAAAVAYSGTTAFNPISIPVDDPDSPPDTTYPYNGNNYRQKVQLMLTTSASFPRVSTMTPSVANSGASNFNNFNFTITGINLPCSNNAGNCATTVQLQQGTATYPASCTGSSAGTSLSCTVSLSGASAGGTRLVISNSGGTLTLPGSPQLGGITIE